MVLRRSMSQVGDGVYVRMHLLVSTEGTYTLQFNKHGGKLSFVWDRPRKTGGNLISVLGENQRIVISDITIFPSFNKYRFIEKKTNKWINNKKKSTFLNWRVHTRLKTVPWTTDPVLKKKKKKKKLGLLLATTSWGDVGRFGVWVGFTQDACLCWPSSLSVIMWSLCFSQLT